MSKLSSSIVRSLTLLTFCCVLFTSPLSSFAEDNPPLTDKQKSILERLDITLNEGESYDEAMLRARRERATNLRNRALEIQSKDKPQSETVVEAERLAAQAQAIPPIDSAAAQADAQEIMKAAMEFAQKAQEQQEKYLKEHPEAIAKPEKAVSAPENKAPVARAQTKSPTPTKPLQIDQVPVAETAAEGDFLVPEITDNNKELELTITLPEKVEITTLIELVGKQLGLNYIYDVNKVRGDIMLKVHNGRIKVKDTYALLESALKFRGFIMTRRGNLVTIVPQAEAGDLDPTIAETASDIKPGDVIVTRVFKLEHITTDVAKNMLTSMKLGISIVDIPETLSVIVTGYAYRMPRIEKMLSLIDLPGKKRDFTYRRLEYTLASSVVEKIKALAQNLGTVEVTVSATATGGTPAKATPVRRDSNGRIIPSTSAKNTTTSSTIGESSQGGVYLDVDDRTNRILMIGSSDELDEVNKLVDAFDVPKQDLRDIKQYKIEYVGAQMVLDALTELGIVTGSTQSNSRSSSYRPGSATANRTAQAQPQNSEVMDAEEILQDQPQVVLIETSNSLLVNATEEQHEKIVSILSFIDVEPEEDAAPVRVYPLENQSVEDIEETLIDIVERIAKDKAENAGLAGTTAGASSSTGKVQKSSVGSQGNNTEVTIRGDLSTNSIVVYASKKDQDWIASLIKELDKKRPQVLIDVTLVEVSKDDSFSFALDVASSGKGLDTTSGAAGAPLTGPTLGNFADGSWSDKSFKGFYSDANVQVLLDTVQTKGYGRIMAKPRLLVNDNQEGTIDSTRTTYKEQTTTTYVDTGDASTPVDSSTYESYSSGVNLTITPHISEGDLLRLEINIKRTDFDYSTSSSDSERPYDEITSDITTVVTVPDKSTIILGGLISVNQGKNGSKVPILGDIPLIGGLFRTIDNSDSQKKLYVFVKANILRPSIGLRGGLEDLIEQSKVHMNSFEEFEDEFQKSEDFPGLDSKSMTPEKVLEMN